MRKVLVGVAAVLLAVVIVLVGAAGVDFGIGIYAEYRLARSVRETAHLGFDPFIAIIGFPLIPQAMRHRYDDLEIKATAVERPVIGKATLESTMHSIDLTDASWLIRPKRQAAGRQAGEPNHHRLAAPWPLPGRPRFDRRSAHEGHQQRHRRHD